MGFTKSRAKALAPVMHAQRQKLGLPERYWAQSGQSTVQPDTMVSGADTLKAAEVPTLLMTGTEQQAQPESAVDPLVNALGTQVGFEHQLIGYGHWGHTTERRQTTLKAAYQVAHEFLGFSEQS